MRGLSFAYDVLVLATGSRPAVHYDGPIPERGVFTLRSRRDADDILAAAKSDATSAKRAVIHGGGLLGLELADALRQRGCAVTILQRSNRLMGRQLDAIASGHVAQELSGAGSMSFLKPRWWSWPARRRCGPCVCCTREWNAPCHAICLCSPPARTPTRNWPARRNSIATRASWSMNSCRRPIRTFLPSANAPNMRITWRQRRPARTQALAAAEFLRGHEHAGFRPTPPGNILKIRGLALAAAGLTDPPADDPSYEIVSLHDPRRHYYQKCVILNDRLVGVICLGDTANFGKYLDWIQTGLELEHVRRCCCAATRRRRQWTENWSAHAIRLCGDHRESGRRHAAGICRQVRGHAGWRGMRLLPA